MVLPVYALLRASILDFRPRLGNRCKLFPVNPSFVHRFLISGPKLGIDARISPFTPSCVHRFLISSPDLRIDAFFCLFTPSNVHRFSISGPDLRIDATQSSWRWRMARLLWPSPQRPSASDSNFRCRKEERPACCGRRRNDLTHPILIFVVAKKNGPPAVAVAATIFRIRFYSSSPQRRIV